MFYRFFIFCSGADFELLNECPSFERGKYASIGATVFFTGLFAFIAASYALSRVFLEGGILGMIVSIFLGFLWGLLIFNLDRYIVASMKKRDNRWNEFLMAIPRIIIAVLISFVIAKPLEVKLFEDRIKQQIKHKKIEALKEDEKAFREMYALDRYTARRDSLESWMEMEPKSEIYLLLKQDKAAAEQVWIETNDRQQPILIRKKTQLERVQSEINLNYRDRKNLEKQLDELTDDSPDRKQLLVDQEKLNKEYARLLPSRNSLRTEISEIEKNLAAKEQAFETLSDSLRKEGIKYYAGLTEESKQNSITLKQNKEKYNEQTGDAEQTVNASFNENFITQVEALGDLTRKEDNPTLWWASILIALLFIVIETAPVFVKLLTSRGPYDDKQLAREKMIRENIEDDINTQVTINTEKNKEILERELRTNTELLQKITESQLNVANEFVKAWEDNEIQKLHGERNRDTQETLI